LLEKLLKLLAISLKNLSNTRPVAAVQLYVKENMELRENSADTLGKCRVIINSKLFIHKRPGQAQRVPGV
jgi:hypothetical protein